MSFPNPRPWVYCRKKKEAIETDVDLRNRKKKQTVETAVGLRNRKKKQTIETDGNASVDLISGLPEPLLHHILCFLSQREAVQTSVLSKSWRNIGPTRPKFHFSEDDFKGVTSKFISVIESTIHRCLNQKLSFRECCLEMSDHSYFSMVRLTKLISLVLDNMAVKSFDLSLLYPRMPCFVVPTNLFRTDSLEKLSLKGCNLNAYSVGDVKLKHLTSLELVKVYIEDENLESLLSGCPLIEHLTILLCYGPKRILLNQCFNLKHFRYCDWNLKERRVNFSIEITIPSIETISIEGCPNWFHHHHSEDGNNIFPLLKSLRLVNVHLSSEFFDCLFSHTPGLESLTLTKCYDFEEYQLSSQSVKHLTIESMNMFDKTVIDDVGYLFPLLNSLCLVNTRLSSEFFDCLSCQFPGLETLNIVSCYGPEKYQISSQSIKHLKIGGSTMFAKAAIDAPSLVEFEYEGQIPTSISFKKTSVEWKSKLVLKSDVNSKYTASLCCLELYEILGGFVGSQISLDISIHFIRDNRKHLKDFPPSLVAARGTRKPIAVEHMTMLLRGHSSSSLSALINDIFCFFRPRNLTQFTYHTPCVVNAIEENQLKAIEENQLIEYLKKVLLSERVMRHCYSWKQDLEEARMEIDPSLTSFIDDEIEKEPFMFLLKWKE